MDKFYIPTTLVSLKETLDKKGEIENNLLLGINILDKETYNDLLETLEVYNNEFKEKIKMINRIHLNKSVLLMSSCNCRKDIQINSLNELVKELYEGHRTYLRPVWYILLQIFDGFDVIEPFTELYRSKECLADQWYDNYYIIMKLIQVFGSTNDDIINLVLLIGNQIDNLKNELNIEKSKYDEEINNILLEMDETENTNILESKLDLYVKSSEQYNDYCKKLDSLRNLLKIDKESFIIMSGTIDENSYFYKDKIPIEITKKIIMNLFNK